MPLLNDNVILFRYTLTFTNYFNVNHRYCATTTFDESGFPLYMRRKKDVTVDIEKKTVGK